MYEGIQDWQGRQWVVRAGDPAYPTVKRLQRQGFGYIVLPWSVLSGLEGDGGPVEHDPVRVWRAVQCLEMLV